MDTLHEQVQGRINNAVAQLDDALRLPCGHLSIGAATAIGNRVVLAKRILSDDYAATEVSLTIETRDGGEK